MDTLLTCSSAEGTHQAAKSRTAIYSLDWALTIVRKALESYPREWEILMDVLQVTERQLAYLIACNDPSWPSLRSLTHLLRRWRDRQARVGPSGLKELPITPQMLSTLLEVGGKNAPESLKAYLTARILSLTIQEQVKRGEGAGSDAPDILSAPPTEVTALGVQYVFDFG